MNEKDLLKSIGDRKYPYGNPYDAPHFRFPKGFSRSTVEAISAFRKEPDFMKNFRLQAYDKLQTMPFPKWSSLNLPEIDLDSFSYFSELDRESVEDDDIVQVMNYLNVGRGGTKVATEFIMDSSSVFSTVQKRFSDLGIVVCSISQALADYPELVQKYLGSVVPAGDNYFAALNSAAFSDGTFVYVPRGVRCPFDVSTYFRINSKNVGQFERTLIVADEGSAISYLEGCTAPAFSEVQLHAAVVEIVALDDSSVSYSTVQNWYPGDADGVGGVYNFVTKRGIAHRRSSISWTQVETGSAKTWKYPSVVLLGDDSQGTFNSISVTKHFQQADTGTKMMHIGNRSKSNVNSKSVVVNRSSNTYRGMISASANCRDAVNFTNCDTLLLDAEGRSQAHPVILSESDSMHFEHEASTASISEKQMAYLFQRGISEREACNLVVHGFCKDILKSLPLEFEVEARQLLQMHLKDAIG